MPETKQRKVYVAVENFFGEPNDDGIVKHYYENRSRVYEGSPEIKKWPHLFEEDRGQFDDYR